MKNRILEKFSLVQVMTDNGLIKQVKISPAYEKKLKAIEDQFARILVGIERLDTCESTSELKAVSAKLLTIIEEDLMNAMGEFMRAYINALFKNVNLPETKED